MLERTPAIIEEATRRERATSAYVAEKVAVARNALAVAGDALAHHLPFGEDQRLGARLAVPMAVIAPE
jgi:hypothetical protein